MARRAKATATLLEQVNEAAAARSKSSDGWIGIPPMRQASRIITPTARAWCRRRTSPTTLMAGSTATASPSICALIPTSASNTSSRIARSSPAMPGRSRGSGAAIPARTRTTSMSMSRSATARRFTTMAAVGHRIHGRPAGRFRASDYAAGAAQGLEGLLCLAAPDPAGNDREGRGRQFRFGHRERPEAIPAHQQARRGRYLRRLFVA